MNETTLKALKASIAKWERNAEAETPDDYRTCVIDCPLCSIFYAPKNCAGCPVSEKTKEHKCDSTPYVKAASCAFDWAIGNWDSLALRDAAQAAAREEVAFLKSLLPEASE